MSVQFRKPNIVALPQRWRQRGSGYFEFAVAAIIVAILAGVLLQKLRFYQDEAERLAVQQVVASVRAALASKAASLYLRGNGADLMALARQNPMDWLERRPPNYAGELEAPNDAVLPFGQWYFDRSTATLSYVLNKRGIFGGSGAKRLNFKVKFAQHPSNVTEIHEGPGPGGVTLEQIDEQAAKTP
jgi:general secretion pathway protein G